MCPKDAGGKANSVGTEQTVLMRPKDADGMANCVDTDQTAP